MFIRNLQKEHVLLVTNISKNNVSKRNLILKKLLTDNKFFVYFKKRLRDYKLAKGDNGTNYLIKPILNSNSPSEIAERLNLENNQITKNLRGVLIHSYLQFKDGVDLTKIDPSNFLITKKEVLSKLIEKIKISQYRAGLFIWGSYTMRQPKISIFSDLDLVLVIDDRELFKKNNFNKFLISLFADVKHYNLPSANEISWLENNTGVARCGFIHRGIFVNFKILTNTALTSCLQIFKESLKEKSCGHFILGFNNEKLYFGGKNQIPVYPIIKENAHYTIGRGLIAEFLHTGELIACSNKNFYQELHLLQLKAMARGMVISNFYKGNSYNLDKYLLELSYTPKKEFNKYYARKLKRSYAKALSRWGNEKPYILQYLYSEIILPLLEEYPRKYWTEKILIAFFTGSPIENGNFKTKGDGKAFKNYFRRLGSLQKKLKTEDVLESSDILLKSIKGERIKFLIKEIGKSLERKDKILLFTSFIDLIEKFMVRRKNFYSILELLFCYLFPNEYGEADLALKNILKKLNDGKDIEALKRKLEKRLLGKNSVYEISYRVRRPEGLFHHHLMKQQPIDEIDDIISFLVSYKKKFLFKKVCNLTEKTLSEIAKKGFQKKMLKIEKYKGCHFYWPHKDVPFEIIVRNLNSGISIEHKIQHSINQKREQRLSFF